MVSWCGTFDRPHRDWWLKSRLVLAPFTYLGTAVVCFQIEKNRPGMVQWKITNDNVDFDLCYLLLLLLLLSCSLFLCNKWPQHLQRSDTVASASFRFKMLPQLSHKSIFPTEKSLLVAVVDTTDVIVGEDEADAVIGANEASDVIEGVVQLTSQNWGSIEFKTWSTICDRSSVL